MMASMGIPSSSWSFLAIAAKPLLPRSHPVQTLRRGDRLDAIATSSPPLSAAPGRCRDVLIAIALAAKVLVLHPRMGSRDAGQVAPCFSGSGKLRVRRCVANESCPT
jgi:hypothetical protein